MPLWALVCVRCGKVLTHGIRHPQYEIPCICLPCQRNAADPSYSGPERRKPSRLGLVRADRRRRQPGK